MLTAKHGDVPGRHLCDLHEDLIKMPASMTECTHRLNAVLPDLSSENRPEPVPPEPHRLVRDVDPAFVQQFLDVLQR